MPEAGAIHSINGGLQGRPSAKKSRSTTSCPIFACSLSISVSFPFPGSAPRRVKAVAMFSIAARFHGLIRDGCARFAGSFGPVAFTGSLFDSSASVISPVRRFSRTHGDQRLTSSSATFALNAGVCVLLFAIVDRLTRHAIHLNNWSEFPRTQLSGTLLRLHVLCLHTVAPGAATRDNAAILPNFATLRRTYGAYEPRRETAASTRAAPPVPDPWQ